MRAKRHDPYARRAVAALFPINWFRIDSTPLCTLVCNHCFWEESITQVKLIGLHHSAPRFSVVITLQLNPGPSVGLFMSIFSQLL
jgi:hypothetical protein